WMCYIFSCFSFFFSSRRRHTRCYRDWSSDVCSSDLLTTFADMFGDVIRQITLSYDEGVPAGKSVSWTGTIDYNDYDKTAARLRRSEERRVGKECRCGWGEEQ